MLVFIASTSYDTIPQKYLNGCKDILDTIFQKHDLIFGACRRGIMKLSYEAAQANHRKIIGVCPKIYQDDFIGGEYTEKIVTPTIVEATTIMLNRCDAMIIMPGGLGTLYEFSQAVQSIVCEEMSSKPIIIYNPHNFYGNLLKHVQKLQTQNFVDQKALQSFQIANTSQELLKLLH